MVGMSRAAPRRWQCRTLAPARRATAAATASRAPSRGAPVLAARPWTRAKTDAPTRLGIQLSWPRQRRVTTTVDRVVGTLAPDPASTGPDNLRVLLSSMAPVSVPEPVREDTSTWTARRSMWQAQHPRRRGVLPSRRARLGAPREDAQDHVMEGAAPGDACRIGPARASDRSSGSTLAGTSELLRRTCKRAAPSLPGPSARCVSPCDTTPDSLSASAPRTPGVSPLSPRVSS